MTRAELGRSGWRWWATIGLVVLTSLLATGLIVFGAVRFLDQAERQRDEVECLRLVVSDQARSTQVMAEAVLDLRRSADERRAALQLWVDDQGRFVSRLEGCGG